jgi:phospholipid/cholesterol/gamma-HCH transport system ATP-binding protein
LIEVRHVSKYFNGKAVIQDISAIFERGKINMIIGRSGSGKTVLLKCIVGLLVPETGQILFDEREFTHASPKIKKAIRKEIGMVFQGGALFDSLTILENVMFPLEMFTNFDYNKRKQLALEALERVNLHNIGNKFPAELSGGMRKRVAIARAIVNKPKYLFFDEPNSGLDPITARVIDDLIIELSREFNTTTIINTHDLQSVLTMSEKIIFIHHGKKWWEGTKEQMLTTDNPELKDFLAASGLG